MAEEKITTQDKIVIAELRAMEARIMARLDAREAFWKDIIKQAANYLLGLLKLK